MADFVPNRVCDRLLEVAWRYLPSSKLLSWPLCWTRCRIEIGLHLWVGRGLDEWRNKELYSWKGGSVQVVSISIDNDFCCRELCRGGYFAMDNLKDCVPIAPAIKSRSILVMVQTPVGNSKHIIYQPKNLSVICCEESLRNKGYYREKGRRLEVL